MKFVFANIALLLVVGFVVVSAAKRPSCRATDPACICGRYSILALSQMSAIYIRSILLLQLHFASLPPDFICT